MKNRAIHSTIIIACVLVAAIGFSQVRAGYDQPEVETVVRVIDARTVELSGSGVVTIAGIVPPVDTDSSTACGAAEATQWLRNHIPEGQVVKYDGSVLSKDGEAVSLTMLRAGWGAPEQGKSMSPDVIEAVDSARINTRGWWEQCG
jgi:endonuclease YncB( thermonuclease family)